MEQSDSLMEQSGWNEVTINHYKYLSIDTLRQVKSLQSHLDGRSTDVSIDSRFGSGLPSTTEDCHHK